ncbi:methylated-DNA--[protein]-cysteine S-methyltransferase [Kitasatospora sp. NPDC015120]|uniref:methylated-DNA--[protein]-cysteine S-methyltransferase n=1 Tax=Kitasatospora sp. NPDC015120 TaxID=3364023 RepID=UPI0036F45CDD
MGLFQCFGVGWFVVVRGVPLSRVHTVVDSPYGWLTLVGESGRLVGLYMEGQRHRPAESAFGCRLEGWEEEPFGETVRQLGEYFAGRSHSFDLPLEFHGTEFQKRVWAALCEIPCGQTWTYGELARHIGCPTSARAVGLANGKNPIGVIVPCHRVVGSDGSLTGYGGGLHRKRRLLDHERALAGTGGAEQTTFF